MRWRYQETVLTLSTVAFFVTMVGRLAISPIIPDIAADLHISNGLIGGALTAMWIAYALVQFPSGVLADRFDRDLATARAWSPLSPVSRSSSPVPDWDGS